MMGNAADKGSGEGHGGGVSLAENIAFLTGNIIRQNHASSTGAGLLLDGGQAQLENTAVIDNQGSGLHLICGAQLDAWHITLARNGDSAIRLALSSDCEGQPGAPSTAVFTNTILASHSVGAFVSADSSLALHGILWHDTPIAFQLEPNAGLSTSWQYAGDPLFAADGHHITTGSAARFKGLPTTVSRDIDGQEPPLDNPAPGADEYWQASYFLPVIQKE
ncbi:MAG: hypothetical protein R6X34_10275 [Chloroflexota bacterium]